MDLSLELIEIIKIVVVGYLAYVGIGLAVAITFGIIYMAIVAWFFRK